MAPSLPPPKSRNINLCFKPSIYVLKSEVKVYNGLFFPSTVSLWNKLPPHFVNTVSMEQFSDHVS